MEVRREVIFPEEAGEVWQALTDPERLADWFANEVELDVAPGGEGTFRWDDGSFRHARVERVDEERSFEFLWWDDETAPTRVEIELEPCPDGTRVSVVESTSAPGIQACAEWSWGVSLLAALARLRPLARA